MTGRIKATFRSFRSPNFRLYVAGNAISVTGDWMQRIGQVWLVLEMTDSAMLLGVTAGLQHLPTLLVGPWGGLLADRLDKRRFLMWTQLLAGILALGLGVAVLTDVVTLSMVLGFAFIGGGITALQRPSKQTFVVEMVGPENVTNAVTLNSVVFNVAKVIGPAIAGVVITAFGVAWSFLGNAASFLCVVGVYASMRTGQLNPAPVAVRAPGQLREGARYIRGDSLLSGTLLLMLVSGMLAYEWSVTLPLLSRDVFHGGAETYGLMFSAMGLGAVVGGLGVASSMKGDLRSVLTSAWVFGALVLLTALSPTLPVALVALFFLGGASIALRSNANALLQLHAAPAFRGRTMAVLGIAVSGSTVIGGPLIGWMGEVAGARVAISVGGVGTVVTAAVVRSYIKRAGAHEIAGFASGNQRPTVEDGG